MENNKGRSRGRPRSFDIEKAVGKAALIFWDRGYEGTSIDDLATEMAITVQSLYAAFGSKAELYKRALAWYQREIAYVGASILDREPDIFNAVDASINELATEFTRSDRPRGCMRSTAAIRSAIAHKDIAEHAADLRRETTLAIKRRLDKACADHQLEAQMDTESFARYLNALIVGMSVAAQDGASRDELSSFSSLAVEALSSYAR